MWITIAQFILSLSILIVLHELGHFSAAKWFKTRVEKFYLFFNPWFSLFKVKLGETEYGIGWLPLGGYVKISGMIDESFDTEQMAGPAQPWEFRSKPAWQRLIIMIGGVAVNFVLGILLFAMVFWVWGERFIPNDSLKEGIAVSSLGYEMGLRNGDKLKKVGDFEIVKFNPGTVNKEIIISGANTIEVERNNQIVQVEIDSKYSELLSKYENKDKRIVHLKMPAVVGEIAEKKELSGLGNGIIEGDKILSINGQQVSYYNEFVEKFLAQNDTTQITTNLEIQRGADTVLVSYKTLFDKKKGLMRKLLGKKAKTQRRLGFTFDGPEEFYDYEIQKYDLVPAFSKGLKESGSFLTDQVKAFSQMFRGKIKASDSLGSFLTIGKLFGPTWNWKNFWWMTAMLSILLGFFNLLPIPALDGGYVMFLLFESITGKKVSDNIMEKATMIGFFLLMGLMCYAFGLDLWRELFLNN